MRKDRRKHYLNMKSIISRCASRATVQRAKKSSLVSRNIISLFSRCWAIHLTYPPLPIDSVSIRNRLTYSTAASKYVEPQKCEKRFGHFA